MKFISILTFICLFTLSLYSQDEIISTELSFDNLSDEGYLTAPSVSFDGSYLIFVVKTDNDEYKFYESTDSSGVWVSPTELKNITDFFGATTYKNAPVYNHDASKIYFSAYNGKDNDIYFSERNSNGWSEPLALPATINTDLNEDEPSISSDNNTFAFIRFLDSKDQECGKIFISKKDDYQKWSNSKQFVSPINLECERSPRILSDNKTILFSSKRNKDKDFKIYYTKIIFADICYIPTFIGELSKQDALYPSADYKGEKLYYSVEQNSKKSKIFQAELPKQFQPDPMTILTGTITDKNGIPISGTISLLDNTSLKIVGLYSTNKKTQDYKIFIPLKSEYLIDFSSKNYSHVYKQYKNENTGLSTEKFNIVLFNKITLWLEVYDKDIFEPLDVNIDITDSTNNTKINFNQTKVNTGRYKLEIPIGAVNKINLTSPNSEPYSLVLDLSGPIIFDEFMRYAEVVSEKIEFSFKISDIDNNEAVDCEIILTNLRTNKKVTTKVTTDSSGFAKVYVRKGDYYDLTINPQGYAFYNTQFEVIDNAPQTITVDLQPLKEDIKIELNNITFETNSADLNEESYVELNKIIELLNNNPSIKVEISAHTDDVGSDKYNLLLSEKRAKSVVDYLILHDIESSRLISKGYGETQPIYPNDTDENRALNRRVELKIIEVSQ